MSDGNVIDLEAVRAARSPARLKLVRVDLVAGTAPDGTVVLTFDGPQAAQIVERLGFHGFVPSNPAMLAADLTALAGGAADGDEVAALRGERDALIAERDELLVIAERRRQRCLQGADLLDEMRTEHGITRLALEMSEALRKGDDAPEPSEAMAGLLDAFNAAHPDPPADDIHAAQLARLGAHVEAACLTRGDGTFKAPSDAP